MVLYFFIMRDKHFSSQVHEISTVGNCLAMNWLRFKCDDIRKM